MGIKGLMNFLKAQGLKERKARLSQMRGKKIAFDTNYLIVKYYSAMKKKLLENYDLRYEIPSDEDVIPLVLDSLKTYIDKFQKLDIKCVMCYDGQMNKLKQLAWDDRKKKKEKVESKLEALVEKIKNASAFQRDAELIEDYSKTYVNYYNSKIIRQITYESQEFFKNLGAEVLIAGKDGGESINPEAEALCANLCYNKVCIATVGSDSDLLAYGVNNMIKDINTETHKGKRIIVCTVINLKSILKLLNMTLLQFVDLCIMCGTDYNRNIPRVGPARAYKLLKTHGKIENIDKDISILNHEVIREIFMSSRIKCR